MPDRVASSKGCFSIRLPPQARKESPCAEKLAQEQIRGSGGFAGLQASTSKFLGELFGQAVLMRDYLEKPQGNQGSTFGERFAPLSRRSAAESLDYGLESS